MNFPWIEFLSFESWKPARQKVRRLQSVRSGLFFAAFLPNIQISGGEIVKNQSALGPLFASTPSAAQPPGRSL
jgi:hypothetical protein